MLSARSEAEFCRKEAARLAAMSRRRASCRPLSGRSRDLSLVTKLLCRIVFFGTGAGGFGRKTGQLMKECLHSFWLTIVEDYSDQKTLNKLSVQDYDAALLACFDFYQTNLCG